MLTTLPNPAVPSPRASFVVAPPVRHDYGVALTAHAFATPVVREVSRPAAEPPGFASTW